MGVQLVLLRPPSAPKRTPKKAARVRHRTFSTLASSLAKEGVQLVFAHPPEAHADVRRLLVAHGVVRSSPPAVPLSGEDRAGPSPVPGMALLDAGEAAAEEAGGACREFATLEDALLFVEEQLLGVAVEYRLCPPPPTCMTLAGVRWCAG